MVSVKSVSLSRKLNTMSPLMGSDAKLMRFSPVPLNVEP